MANPIPKSPQVLLSEIAIKSQAFGGLFLLLEGSFDMRFWEERLNEAVIKRIECVGKENLLKTLSLVHAQLIATRILALADRDFDPLLNRTVQSRGLVYTDENDLELTLLLSNGSIGNQTFIERIISGSTDLKKLMPFETQMNCTLVEHLRSLASHFGVLRYLNEKLALQINFDQLSILNQQWFNHAALSLNCQNLNAEFLRQVMLAVPSSTFTAQDLANEISVCTAQGWLANWQLVQGHDFLKLLGSALKSSTLKLNAAPMQISEATLQRDLILMIDKPSLAATSMAMSLTKLVPNQQVFH